MASRTRRFRPRFIFVVFLFLSVAVTTGIWFLLHFKPSPTEINLTGSSTDLGAASGRALRWRTRLITWIYLDRVVCQNRVG